MENTNITESEKVIKDLVYKKEQLKNCSLFFFFFNNKFQIFYFNFLIAYHFYLYI